MHSASGSPSGSKERAGRVRALAAAIALTALIVGCQYGYSRSALQGEPAAPSSSYVGIGYGMGWGAPGSYASLSYRYAYPYGYPANYPYYYAYDPMWYPPPYMYYYDPWWYYGGFYYPYYPYYPAYGGGTVHHRTFRVESGPGASPPSSPPSSSPAPRSSGRRFRVP